MMRGRPSCSKTNGNIKSSCITGAKTSTPSFRGGARFVSSPCHRCTRHGGDMALLARLQHLRNTSVSQLHLSLVSLNKSVIPTLTAQAVASYYICGTLNLSTQFYLFFY